MEDVYSYADLCDARDEGYSEGYERGYSDGYEDGCWDAQRSED